MKEPPLPFLVCVLLGLASMAIIITTCIEVSARRRLVSAWAMVDAIKSRLEVDGSDPPDGAESQVGHSTAGSRINLYDDSGDHNKVALTNEARQGALTMTAFLLRLVLGLAGAICSCCG